MQRKIAMARSYRLDTLRNMISSFNVGFPSNVYELVASGRYQQGRWFKKLNAEDHEHIERSLKSVGMWDQRNKRIGDLSGGQNNASV